MSGFRISLLVAAVASMGYLAHAGDPGDLFPEVSYDSRVSTPVNQPDRAVARTTPRSTPREAPRRETPRETKPVREVNEARTTTVKPEPPEVVKTASTAPAVKAAVLTWSPGAQPWAPYSEALFKPFLTPAEQAQFDQEFAPEIAKALAGTFEDRKRVMQTLTDAAEARGSELKRYVLLHVVGLAIKNNAPLPERSTRAMKVLPLLSDSTLAVFQAKADCLANLARSAPEHATDKLWSMLAEADAGLARLQVQTAFPKEAAESVRKARDAFGRLRAKAACKSELISEAQAWADYAAAAASDLPDLRETLRREAADTAANRRLAMYFLVLYADLRETQIYAAQADREDLKKLAAVLAEVKFPAISGDPKEMVAAALKIARGVLEVAKASTQQIERYALASFVLDRLEQIRRAASEQGELPAWARVRSEALSLKEKNAFKPLASATTQPATSTAPAEPDKPETPQNVTPTKDNPPKRPQTPQRPRGRWRFGH